MLSPVLRFTFAVGVDLADAEATLHLAILAAEGLFGEALVRMEVSYFTDPSRRVIHIETGSVTGDAVAKIFTAFVIREFGEGAFVVGRARVGSPATESVREAAA